MGFFDSLKDGLAKAGSFLVSHSEDIMAATSSVAKIATGFEKRLMNNVLRAVANANSDDELVASLLPSLEDANASLIRVATVHVNGIISPLASSQNSTQEDLLSGIWDLPASPSDGEAPPDMYEEVANFLQASNIPTHVNTSGESGLAEASIGGIFDVARNIADIMFSNLQSATASDAVTAFDFDFTELAGSGVTIAGSHAYYLIPLGEASHSSALHSAVVIHTYRTKEFAFAESIDPLLSTCST